MKATFLQANKRISSLEIPTLQVKTARRDPESNREEFVDGRLVGAKREDWEVFSYVFFRNVVVL